MHRSLYAGNVKHWRLLMEFILKEFNELSVLELYKIYELRSRVFVVEQNCAYQDPDVKDVTAHHLMLFVGEKLIGYARLIPPGLSYDELSIGRVIIDQAYRSRGAGQKLMLFSVEQLLKLYGQKQIVISAQSYLINFYTKLGFVAEGEEYIEDDIPHIRMRLIKRN